MGSAIAKLIAEELYPLVKQKLFPVIEKNLSSHYATQLKNKINSLFYNIKQEKLPSGFDYEIPTNAAIGQYANKINLITFLVNCRVRVYVWNQKYSKGPDYLHARITFQTKFGLNDWITAVAGQVEVRSSVF